MFLLNLANLGLLVLQRKTSPKVPTPTSGERPLLQEYRSIICFQNLPTVEPDFLLLKRIQSSRETDATLSFYRAFYNVLQKGIRRLLCILLLASFLKK
jgi:hypothetical protein